MEEARKKLRVCLICVVAVAVLLGAVYYFQDVKSGKGISEGTLITIAQADQKTGAYTGAAMKGSLTHVREGGAHLWQ